MLFGISFSGHETYSQLLLHEYITTMLFTTMYGFLLSMLVDIIKIRNYHRFFDLLSHSAIVWDSSKRLYLFSVIQAIHLRQYKL